MKKKITGKRLESLGFKLLVGSYNPRYFIFESTTDVKLKVWIGYSSREWTIRKEYDDCTSKVRVISTMEDVLHAVIEHGFYKGRKYQSLTIKKSIDDFGKSV